VQSICHPRAERNVAQKPFANNSPSDYRSDRQTSESHDDNNHLAFIPKTGMDANASDRKSGAFLFSR